MVHNRTNTSFSVREIASDCCCQSVIDCLLWSSICVGCHHMMMTISGVSRNLGREVCRGKLLLVQKFRLCVNSMEVYYSAKFNTC